MKENHLQQRAFQLYAAIGELTIRKKQMNQQLTEIDSKLTALEKEIVKLSQSQSDQAKEGVHNVD